MDLACVADGIVSARELKFWWRSRQASCEAARKMGRGTSGCCAAKTLFRACHTASYAGHMAHKYFYRRQLLYVVWSSVKICRVAFCHGLKLLSKKGFKVVIAKTKDTGIAKI